MCFTQPRYQPNADFSVENRRVLVSEDVLQPSFYLCVVDYAQAEKKIATVIVAPGGVMLSLTGLIRTAEGQYSLDTFPPQKNLMSFLLGRHETVSTW